MRTKITYFVKLKDGKAIWYAPDTDYPKDENIIEIEERIMLFPEEGKVLIHKETKEISYGHWLLNDYEDNWEEIDEPEEKEETETIDEE